MNPSRGKSSWLMFPSFPHLELLYFTFNHIFVQAGNVNEKGEDAQMVKR